MWTKKLAPTPQPTKEIRRQAEHSPSPGPRSGSVIMHPFNQQISHSASVPILHTASLTERRSPARVITVDGGADPVAAVGVKALIDEFRVSGGEDGVGRFRVEIVNRVQRIERGDIDEGDGRRGWAGNVSGTVICNFGVHRRRILAAVGQEGQASGDHALALPADANLFEATASERIFARGLRCEMHGSENGPVEPRPADCIRLQHERYVFDSNRGRYGKLGHFLRR
ncbi:hypothetical protein FIBSPDRAFT_84851 [Athelia psychrophila]|uniref:Uncharacterized protein n=1 Tax=Athelia psychrophila TaxID=1759441 RepID=A0A167SVD9_9AGAM|nr:hypothetical protein FIBSPDRAFT_84851 [Fibularhizoctonia sp. CBS 109695]